MIGWHALTRIVLIALVAVGGCTTFTEGSPRADGGADGSASACPGGAPYIGECFYGLDFADCGGSGEPVFGCATGMGCHWFTGGCVARGFQASPCPWNDLCCLDGWPFPSGRVDASIKPAMHAMGLFPSNRTRATNITVTIDPTLAPAASETTCTGTDPWRSGGDASACWSSRTSPPAVYVRAAGGTRLISLTQAFTYAGSMIGVEIIPGAPAPVARACVHEYTDAYHPTETCEPARPPVPATTADDESDCLTSGTLVLDADPFSTRVEDLHGRFEGAFEDTFSIVATF